MNWLKNDKFTQNEWKFTRPERCWVETEKEIEKREGESWWVKKRILCELSDDNDDDDFFWLSNQYDLCRWVDKYHGKEVEATHFIMMIIYSFPILNITFPVKSTFTPHLMVMTFSVRLDKGKVVYVVLAFMIFIFLLGTLGISLLKNVYQNSYVEYRDIIHSKCWISSFFP